MVTSAAGELVITTSSWIQASVDEKLLCAKVLSAALLVRYLGSDRQQAAENKQTNKKNDIDAIKTPPEQHSPRRAVPIAQRLFPPSGTACDCSAAPRRWELPIRVMVIIKHAENTLQPTAASSSTPIPATLWYLTSRLFW